MKLRCLHLANLKLSENRLKEPLLAELQSDILKLDAESPIDFIVTSGNVVEVANEVNFGEARKWFETLAETTKRVTSDRLSFAPGEADICRKSIVPLKTYIKDSFRGASDETLEKVIKDSSQKKIVISGFEKYLNFKNMVTNSYDSLPWQSRSYKIHGQTIGIATLSANWLFGIEEDQDQPCIGSLQLNETRMCLKNTDVKILVIHNSLENLDDDDREALRGYIQKNAIALLTSSVHTGSTQVLDNGEQRALVLSGSSLSCDSGLNPAYQYFDYDLDTGKLSLFRRIFQRSWIPDRNTFSPDDYREYTLVSGSPATFRREKEQLDESFVTLYRKSFECFFERLDSGNLGNVYSRETGLFKPYLDSYYLPLSFKKLSSGREVKSRKLTVDQIKKAEQSFLVRGGCGTGKTTWIRYTFRQMIRDKGVFPIFLELRHLSPYWRNKKGKGEDFHLIEFIEDNVSAQMSGHWAGAIDHVLTAYNGPTPILLIDGWDEIGDFGEDLRRKLYGLRINYPKLVVVITTRPYAAISNIPYPESTSILDLNQNQGVSNDGLSKDEERDTDFKERAVSELRVPTHHDLFQDVSEGEKFNEKIELALPRVNDYFEIYDIHPLSQSDIDSLVQRFYDFYYGKLSSQSVKKRQSFLSDLSQSKEAYNLVKTPLFLTMTLFVSEVCRLPDKRHQLYEKCIENVLSYLPKKYSDEGVLNERSHDVPDDPDERIRVVSKAAYGLQSEFFCDSESSFSIEFSHSSFSKYLPSTGKWRESYQNNFVNWLVDRAGLLLDQSGRKISFAHLSFQEYLAANYIKSYFGERSEKEEVIARYSRHLPWWETLRIWLALEHRENPERTESLLSDAILLKSHYNFWFFGSVLADNVSIESPVDIWLELLPLHLEKGCDIYVGDCARMWKDCDDNRKRHKLTEKILFLIESNQAPKEYLIFFSEKANIGWPVNQGKSIQKGVDQLFEEHYGQLLAIVRRFEIDKYGLYYEPGEIVNEIYLHLRGNSVKSLGHFFNLFHLKCRHLVHSKIASINAAKRSGRYSHICIEDLLWHEERFPETWTTDGDLHPVYSQLRALQKERPEIYEIIVLHYIFGLQYSDLVEVLGVSRATIVRRLRMGKALLSVLDR